ncbi:MAG: hypothetical protein MR413_06810 [Clostridia bacterium]|nr:hypothetical protein [Clostridia bacterium]
MGKKKILTIVITAAVIAAILGIIGVMAYNRFSKMQAENAAKAIEEANEYISSGDYYNAICTYDQNMKYDRDHVMEEKRRESFLAFAEQLKDGAYAYIHDYNYVEAVQYLNAGAMLDKGDDPEFSALYQTCVKYQNFVVYDGVVEHVFFHPLIAYPEKAFTGDYMENNMDDYFVTANEFIKIMQRFYENNYILIDIRLLYGVDGNGNVYKKELYLPEGKKPLVLSIDDLNYYDYMDKYGIVTGMEVGADGKTVVSFTETPEGRVFSDNNDIVPIMDKMIKEHPDFSWGGHKGTVALTGYEGALGYRTDMLDSPDYDAHLADARRLADVMKNNGWNFACHSYGHVEPETRSVEWFYNDIDRWIREVEPVVGKTDIYVYPFGDTIEAWDDRFQYMLKQDFKMFCGVYMQPELNFYQDYVFMQRRNIDGIAFREHRLDDLMDFTGIPDADVRPDRGY